MQKQYLIAIFLVLSFALGATTMWWYQQYLEDHPQFDDTFLDGVFDDRFFERSRSPFEEMERIQKEMDDLFGRGPQYPSFDSWFDARFGEFPVDSIKSREDSEFVYYVMEVGDKSVANIDVTTSQGYVTIEAELSEESGGYSSTTSINQKFPVPHGVEEKSVEVLHEGDEVLIRFRKNVL